MMFTKRIFSQRLATLLLTALLLSLPAMATGTTYYVDDDAADNTGDGLSPGTAWKTIKYAAANVPAGTAGAPNVIMVAAGLYDNTNNGEVFPIAFNNDYVSLTGAGAGSTTIDAESSGNALGINGMGFSVSGFTFDNTSPAIDLSQGGFAISNNIFTANVDTGVDFRISETDLSTDYAVGNTSVTNNTFNGSSGDSVYFRVHLDYDELTSGLTASLGTVDISSNTFTDCSVPIYVEDYYITEMYNGTATIGNQTYDNNTITNSSDGIYLDNSYIDYMYAGSTATLGNIAVTNNSCDNCTGDAFYIKGMWLEDLYDSTGTLGDLTVTGNTVTNGGTRGIYVYDYYISYLYDNSTATAGNVTISGNTITGCSGQNIYFYNFYTEYLYSSSATMGNLVFKNNTLTDGSRGVYVYGFYIGYLYGSQATLGDWTASNNTLKNHTSNGFYFDYWSVWYTYGPSTATLGNIYFANNKITTAAGSGNGLNFSDLYYIEEIYDTSVINVGTINLTSNTITAYNAALSLYYEYISTIGEYSYDAPQITAGTTNITGNKLTSTNSYALYLYYYDIGYDVYGMSKIYMGATNVTGNTLKGYNEGLYFDFDECAYNMYHSSMFDWKPITIHNNTITSTSSSAIYIYYYEYDMGSYMEDNSQATLPGFIITNNTIDTEGTSYGFYFENLYNPYENYDQAYVDFGSVLIDGNTFNPDKNAGMDYGVYWYTYENNDYVYDHTTTVFGDFTVSNNKFYNIGDEAIWLDTDGFPYDADDYNTFIAGDFSITNNMIAGASYGIDLEFDYFDVLDFTTSTVGTFTVANNTLTDITTTGIYVDMETENDNPTTASLTIGATTIKDNMITADAGGADEGIFFYGDIDYSGVTFGMPTASRNTITGFTDGIVLSETGAGLDEMTISCNWLQNNTGNGIRVDSEGTDFTVTKNALTGNTAFGLSVDNGNTAMVMAENNWWGDAAGPAACFSCNGVNPGDMGTVDFTPWLNFEPDKRNCDRKFPWMMFAPATTGMSPANP